jgi:pterin-4a-carbinolamine dehydratase
MPLADEKCTPPQAGQPPLDRVAEIAQADDHHSDICLCYNRVELKLSTHKIGGLSCSDFIVAAKIDRISPSPAGEGARG